MKLICKPTDGIPFKEGYLYWEIEKLGFFPELNWTDLSLSVIDMWLNKIRTDKSVYGTYLFIDGPFQFSVFPTHINFEHNDLVVHTSSLQDSAIVAINIIKKAKEIRKLYRNSGLLDEL